MMMRWHLSRRCDPKARELADRHYNRQSIGADNFVPPGRCLVLVAKVPRIEGSGEDAHKREEIGALWVTSWPFAEFTHHAWAGAWVNSLFRNERPDVFLSSELILEAVAATRWFFKDPPSLGMVTFVDPTKTLAKPYRKQQPGGCYRKAGFKVVGETKVNKLVALQLLPEEMPAAEPAHGMTYATLLERMEIHV